MIMQAVLGNASHPEYGVATIPLPIPREQYDHCIELLEALGIGNARERDCKVMEFNGPYPVLKRLEMLTVNLDELDYLAKRLDSFSTSENAQFQAMAHKLELFEMKDLINLTFCCQQATVITDFTNLESVGTDHYMNLHGGCASMEELENLDRLETALLLIDNGGGVITPYGVVYDNGMQLNPLYDGKHLPCYHYEADLLSVALTSRQDSGNPPNITWFYLPASHEQIDHAILRSGITDPADMYFQFADSSLPTEIDIALDFSNESIYDLNDMALAIEKLSDVEFDKLGAAVTMAKPESANQIRHLAENLDQFEFAPKVYSPAEYGKYMIQESGRFEFDPNLDEFYDYEGYALQRMEQQYGMFTDRGYVSYHGVLSLDELMMEDPAQQYQEEQGFQMGGMQ